MKMKACASASGGVIFVPETLSRKSVTKPLTKTIMSKGKGISRTNDNKTTGANA